MDFNVYVYRFLLFEVEVYLFCGYDYVEVCDGDSFFFFLMGWFCGCFVFDFLRSIGNFMVVNFVIDFIVV